MKKKRKKVGSLFPALGWKTTEEEEARYRQAIMSADAFMEVLCREPRIGLPADMQRQTEEETQYYFE